MTHRKHIAGVTLLELMVVVGLIGVLAAGIVPSLNASRSDSEVANVAASLVRLGSRARAHAAYTGLAHALAYLPDVGVSDGVILVRGTSPRCNNVVWDFAVPMSGQVATQENNNSVVRGGRGAAGLSRIRIEPAAGVMNAVQICIQPNGHTLLRNGNVGLFTETIGGINDVLFNVWQDDGTGVAMGPRRQVIFPSANLPRWVH